MRNRKRIAHIFNPARVFNSQTGTNFPVRPIGLLFFCIMSALVVYAYKQSVGKNAATAYDPVNPIAASEPEPVPYRRQLPASNIETEIIRIDRYGFDPTEIRRPPGRFFLYIRDFTDTTNNDIVLRLDAQEGSRIFEAGISKNTRRWAGSYDLPPGRYVLTAHSHPDWICRITITEK